MKPVRIDGTTLEGGGQLVRLTVGLAALTGRAVELFDIRGGRPGGGGLKAQHLTAVKWLAGACNAHLEGAEIGSRRLLFEPGRAAKPWWSSTAKLPDGTSVLVVDIDVGGVGATTLVLQAILPFLLFARQSSSGEVLPILLKLIGGTNASFSPSIDYVEQVLFPNFALLGLPLMQISPHHRLRRGYTKGPSVPGEVSIIIHPAAQMASLRPLRLPERGEVTKIDVTLHASTLMSRKLIHQRTAKALGARLADVKLGTIAEVDSGHASKMYLLLVAHSTSGFRLAKDWLYEGKIGATLAAVDKAIESLVTKVVDGIADELGQTDGAAKERSPCLDSKIEDQVPVYMALARGRSACEPIERAGRAPSLHTLTAQWVVGELLGVTFDTLGECEGIGLEPGQRQVVVDRRAAEPSDEELAAELGILRIG